jgi:N-acetylmuramoyl-L-alanine amidase
MISRRKFHGSHMKWLITGAAAFFLAAAVAQSAAAGGETDATPDPDASPVPSQRPPDTPYPPRRADCRPEKLRIALDVGHTPEASGAISARGVKEHAFNLQLARRIQKELIDGGFVHANLIAVHGSGRAQLVKRIEQANASGADLLLSIHHDDVQIAYHDIWTHDGAPHAYSDRFSGYSLFVSRDNRRFEDSLAFAKFLGAALAARGLRYSAHHAEPIRGEGRRLIDPATGVYQFDQLYVLRSSASPAVLMEAGIIVNRAEEVVLASPEGQRHISAAVLAAMDGFCVAHSASR